MKPDILHIVEALLFASSEPLSVDRLARMAGSTRPAISEALKKLKTEYEREGKSFQMVRIAGDYQLRTREAYSPWVKKLFQPRAYTRLSRPALETLAIIAYKQPITRPEIETIRGVNVEGIIKSLVERELVRISGQKEVVGRPYLYRTSQRFLGHFGLNSLKDLPPLSGKEKPTATAMGSARGAGKGRTSPRGGQP